MAKPPHDGRRWIAVVLELLLVAPSFAVFVPGAYVGLTSTMMLMLSLGDDARFDWPFELMLLGLSSGAVLGLLGLALAIPLPAPAFRQRTGLRRLTMCCLVAGSISAATGLFFVLRELSSLEPWTLLMWLWLLGAPLAVGGRHLVRLLRARGDSGAVVPESSEG